MKKGEHGPWPSSTSQNLLFMAFVVASKKIFEIVFEDPGSRSDKQILIEMPTLNSE